MACSLILPPTTELGKTAGPVDKKVVKSAISCPTNTFPTIGYCIERFDLPENADIGSLIRRRIGNHFMVCVGDRGSWDPIKEKYFTTPHVYEIWHPKNEKNCKYVKARDGIKGKRKDSRALH